MNQYERENEREIIMCAEQIFYLTEVVRGRAACN